VTGIPYVHPTGCDSCRIALARTEVDSIRLGDPIAGFWKSAALVLAVLVPLWLVYRGASD
jgi:hypothetical protein